jgi:broad specificity phosphatase PhoE
MTRLYLIRHAEAEGNIQRKFQGHLNGDISDNGEQQLERLKERCKWQRFDAIYASPLRRTYKTACAVNHYHALPIIKDGGLIEINGGHWEGKRWDDLPDLYPEENRHWEDEPWLFNPKGGESMREVYDRIWDTIISIVKKHPNQTICVVSHGCVIRNFACRASGKPIEQLQSIDWVENTAINIFDFDENLRPTVIALNDASHLDEETSTITKQDWWQKAVVKKVVE